jgi:hypothetical protein
MADEKAQQIIQFATAEKNKSVNIKNQYQQFADLGYPVENQITSKRTYGEDKSLDIRDPTAMFALDKATAGFIGAWIPRERYFFNILINNRAIAERDEVKRWCALAVQIAHDEIFSSESSYMTNLHNTVKAAIGFGTGNNYSDWDRRSQCLTFKDWHVSYYDFKQNEKGIVDTMILQYDMTARQLAMQFDNPGEDVLKAVEKLETESRMFSLIHLVRPRIKRNYMVIDKMNMPFESIFVNVKEKKIIKEGGFEEFPFAVSRWEKASCEKWGRGRGLAMLSFIKELQQMRMDITESRNRRNRPPYEVVANNVEGEVNLKPDGRTNVTDRNSITPLNSNFNGNPNDEAAQLEEKKALIKEGFYGDLFSKISDLKGDRRVQLHLELLNQETMAQMVSPVARMESEHFTPQISRIIKLLMRNSRNGLPVIPPPPPALSGQSFGIEYMGRLAMAMRDMQARGFERGMAVVGQMSQMFPEAADQINLDRALPDLLINYGMKVEHLNTPEEKAAKKQQRAQDLAQQKAAMAAQVAGKAYSDTTGKPEEGSAAEMAMAGMGAK